MPEENLKVKDTTKTTTYIYWAIIAILLFLLIFGTEKIQINPPLIYGTIALILIYYIYKYLTKIQTQQPDIYQIGEQFIQHLYQKEGKIANHSDLQIENDPPQSNQFIVYHTPTGTCYEYDKTRYTNTHFGLRKFTNLYTLKKERDVEQLLQQLKHNTELEILKRELEKQNMEVIRE